MFKLLDLKNLRIIYQLMAIASVYAVPVLSVIEL